MGGAGMGGEAMRGEGMGGEAVRGEGVGGPILRGAMTHVRLASTVQMLLNEGICGRLEVRTPDGDGWVSLQGGVFRSARFGSLEGEKAVIGLLLCRNGDFELVGEPRVTGRREGGRSEEGRREGGRSEEGRREGGRSEEGRREGGRSEEAGSRGTGWEGARDAGTGSDEPVPGIIRADPFSLLLEALRVQDHWEALAARTLPGIDAKLPDTPFLQALRAGARVDEAARTAGLHPVQALAELEQVPAAGISGPQAPLADLSMNDPSTDPGMEEWGRPEGTSGPGMEEWGRTEGTPGQGREAGRLPDTPVASAGTSAGVPSQRTFLLLLELGTEAFRAQRLDEAEQHWRQAERLYPGDRRVRLNLNVLGARRRLAGEGRIDGRNDAGNDKRSGRPV